MALQMGSPSNSWPQAFYGHTSLQITLMAKIQRHTQVFCHIPDPRIKFLTWQVEPKGCPDKSLQKWVERLTFLSLFISTFLWKSGARANWKLWASGTSAHSTYCEGRTVSAILPSRHSKRGPCQVTTQAVPQGHPRCKLLLLVDVERQSHSTPKERWTKLWWSLTNRDPDMPTFPPALQVRQYASRPLDLTLWLPKSSSIWRLS